MAQTFVGANNIPLLEEDGQFGTRLSGGKDAASPRYILLTNHQYLIKFLDQKMILFKLYFRWRTSFLCTCLSH